MSIQNLAELRAAIAKKELQAATEKQELITQFHQTKESLKPKNLVKSAVHKIIPENVLGVVLKAAGTLGVGILTSKLTAGSAAASTGSRLIKTLFSQSASHIALNNMDKIKAYGIAIYKNLFKK
jgi:hypothetical protein